MIPKDKFQDLVRKAHLKHSVVRPCGDKETFLDCITQDMGMYILWFDFQTVHGWSTSVVTIPVDDKIHAQ